MEITSEQRFANSFTKNHSPGKRSQLNLHAKHHLSLLLKIHTSLTVLHLLGLRELKPKPTTGTPPSSLSDTETE